MSANITGNKDQSSVAPDTEHTVPKTFKPSKGAIQGHAIENRTGKDKTLESLHPATTSEPAESRTFSAHPIEHETKVKQVASVIQGTETNRVEDLQKMLVKIKPTIKYLGNISDEKSDIIDHHYTSICQKVAEFEKSGKKEMRFSKQVDSGGGKIPFTFNLIKNDDGSTRVSITFPKDVPGARIALTGYKIVKKGFRFEIPPRSAKVDVIVRFPSIVVARVHKEKEVPGRTGDVVQPNKKSDVLEGLEVSKNIMQEIGETAAQGMVSIPLVRKEYTSQHGESRLELEMDWMNGDLFEVVHHGKLPLDMNQNKFEEFNMYDKLEVIKDVGNTLQHFHDKNYVHHDIKTSNILIDVKQNVIGKYVLYGKVADFDFTQKMGVRGENLYIYYSPLAQKGFVTADCDVYGMAFMLGECMFKNFYSMVNSYHQNLRNIGAEEQFDALIRLISTGSEYHNILQDARDPKKNPNQHPEYKIVTTMRYLEMRLKNKPTQEEIDFHEEITRMYESMNQLPDMYDLNRRDLFQRGIKDLTQKLFQNLNLDFQQFSKELDLLSDDPDTHVAFVERLLDIYVDKTALTDSQKQELSNFKAELLHLPAMWKLVTEQFKGSYELEQAFFRERMHLNPLEGHEDEIKTMMTINGVLSAQQFAEEVKNIQEKIVYT